MSKELISKMIRKKIEKKLVIFSGAYLNAALTLIIVKE
jgi:hypothetical protein